ncbi:Imm31 family immunity protein [Orbus wheelerorum]|uniref:hypothetical protein n=1 Tax=Orbus wheelerorum TaxID=3074111 RepID=UPI00370D9292
MNSRLSFFSEVEILAATAQKQLIHQKGVIIGISEEDGVIYGYGVLIHGREGLDFFEAKDLKPTGKQFKREDFY